MKSGPDDAETIRRQMARIGRSYHDDIREVLAAAETVAGMRRHMRLMTWVAMGAATAILMFTSRRRKTAMKKTGEELATPNTAGTKETEKPVEDRTCARLSLVGEVADFLTTVAIRAAQNYTTCRLEEWLESRPRLGAHITAPISHGSDSLTPPGGWPESALTKENGDKTGSVLLAGHSRELEGVSRDG